MRDFLERIRPSAERRAGAARRDRDELRRKCAALAPPRKLELSSTGFDLIAEVKRRAPSAGTLAGAATSVVERAAAYVGAGAAAISVLTEPDHFSGSIEDLARVSARVERPTLAKDFLLDPAQLYEARAAGAAGALLIVRMLDDATLRAMIDAAAEARLFLLLESFNEADLERTSHLTDRCHSVGVEVLAGVNARDLSTFEVHFERFEQLEASLPADVPAVAESGITDARTAAEVSRRGYRLALVGTALMQVVEPLGLAAAMVASGRAAATSRREAPCECA